MYEQMLVVISPVLLITAIGYLYGKTDRKIDSEALSTLVLSVATPALIFSTLTSLNIDKGTVANMALAAALSVAIALAMGALALAALGLPQRTFLPSLMMPNSGNIGLPLALLAYGQAGLALSISYFLVIALLQYTLGAAIVSGQYRFRALVGQPLVYSIVLSYAVIFFDLRVPVIIARTTELLGGMMIPVMLILLGAALARLAVTDVKQALILASARLVIGAATGLIVVYALGMEGVVAGTVFLMASMPAAIVTYVFAARYRPDAAHVAGLVVMSTLMTFALLPVLLWISYWLTNNT